MRNLKVTAEEANLVFNVVNAPTDPRKGLSTAEIRAALSLFEKCESLATKERVPQGEKLTFKDGTLEMKESEYSLLLNKFEEFTGWTSMEQGRKVVNFVNSLKELPSVGND